MSVHQNLTLIRQKISGKQLTQRGFPVSAGRGQPHPFRMLHRKAEILQDFPSILCILIRYIFNLQLHINPSPSARQTPQDITYIYKNPLFSKGFFQVQASHTPAPYFPTGNLTFPAFLRTSAAPRGKRAAPR